MKNITVYSDKSPERYFWKQFLIKQDVMVYIKKFMSEYENKQPGYESILESLSTIITNELIRSILEVPASSDLFIEKLETEKAIAYMHQNFGCKLKVEYLARLVNMSESHFIRTFKKETQLSPIEYLIRLRLDKVKKLIRAKSNTITEIALQCGFNSSPHFSSCFLKQYGIIFHTAVTKDVYNQVLKNPKAELCFCENGTQIRISGKLEIVDENKLKDEISEHPTRKFLKPWRESGDLKDFYNSFAVLKLRNGAATIWTMEKNFAPKEMIQL